MSVTVETAVASPGDDRYVTEAWELKERIRRSEGVLKQRRAFFDAAYRRGTCHLILSTDDNGLLGFSTTRNGGYVLFLAVSPDYRNMGFGRELVSAVAEQYGTVTCHARVTNEHALAFYDHLGFEIVRRIDGYYEDGGDAYYLRLGEGGGFTSRLFELLGR